MPIICQIIRKQGNKEGKVAHIPPATEAREVASGQNSISCPNCGVSIPADACFCPECGFGLKQAASCPNCGSKTTPGADICEACKTWLLEGKCKFCYAELPSGATFCPECGNSKDGIKCPSCGTLSIFDFCTTCGKPLTEGAEESKKLVNNDPIAKAMIEAVEQAADISSELAELETLINDIPDYVTEEVEIRRPVKNKAVEEKVRQEKDQKREAKIQVAKDRKEVLRKQRDAAIAAARASLVKIKDTQFTTNQDARRFHNATKKPFFSQGWRCNFVGYIHPDGPNGCANPSLGGHWV